MDRRNVLRFSGVSPALLTSLPANAEKAPVGVSSR